MDNWDIREFYLHEYEHDDVPKNLLLYWRQMNIVDIDELLLYSVVSVCHCCCLLSLYFPRFLLRLSEVLLEEVSFHPELILNKHSVDVFDYVHRVESMYQRKIRMNNIYMDNAQRHVPEDYLDLHLYRIEYIERVHCFRHDTFLRFLQSSINI